MEELIETIKGAIDDYRTEKTKDIEIDDDTDFEIFKATTRIMNSIKEDIEELDGEIDNLVECMDETSDYENDLKLDNYARTRDLIGG